MNKLTLVNKNRYLPGYEYILFRDNINRDVFDNINEIKVFNSDINIINFVQNYFSPKIDLLTDEYVVYNLRRNIYNVIFSYQDNVMHYKLTAQTINKIGYLGFISETKEKEYKIELDENIYYEVIVMLNSLIFDIYIPSNYLDMYVENRHIAKYTDSKTINDYLVTGKLKLKNIVENCSLSFVLDNVTNIDTLLELYIMCFRNLTGTPFHDAVVEKYNEFCIDVAATFRKINGFEINKRVLVNNSPFHPGTLDGEHLIIKKENRDILLINKVTKNSALIEEEDNNTDDILYSSQIEEEDNITSDMLSIEYCNEMLKNDIVMIKGKAYSKAQIHYHSPSKTKGYNDSYQKTATCSLCKYYQIKDYSLAKLSSHCCNNNVINRCKGWIVIPELIIFDPSNYFQYNIVKQKFFDIDFTVLPYKIDNDILNTIRDKIICNL